MTIIMHLLHISIMILCNKIFNGTYIKFYTSTSDITVKGSPFTFAVPFAISFRYFW